MKSSATALSEIDIPTEVQSILYDDVNFKKIGVPFVSRKFRRTSNNKRVNCLACNKASDGSVEGIQQCPYCQGTGFLFDETIEVGFFYRTRYFALSSNLREDTSAGRADTPEMTLITSQDIILEELDHVKPYNLLPNGNIKIPPSFAYDYEIYYARQMSTGRSGINYNIYALNN